ncbi:MAG TPA: Rrf2 family transcriptional regulator [Anaerolineales bacterium]|nr:Rrf2 family transcriptional regulator [Anaerolineales bacterium]
MQITRQADYATRAILYLARHQNGKHIATSQIAKEQNISSSFLAKIISQLSIAGLLYTSRGANGGISLARDPKQITLLQVIEAIDGPIQLNTCVAREDACSFEGNCSIQSVWCDAQNELIAKLRNTNFAELMA